MIHRRTTATTVLEYLRKVILPEYEELRKVEPKGTAEYVIARTRGKRGGDTTENRNKRRKQQKQNKCEP